MSETVISGQGSGCHVAVHREKPIQLPLVLTLTWRLEKTETVKKIPDVTLNQMVNLSVPP